MSLIVFQPAFLITGEIDCILLSSGEDRYRFSPVQSSFLLPISYRFGKYNCAYYVTKV